jgi:hypothetical protein
MNALMKKSIIIFFILTSLTSVFAQYPAVNTSRPRIWLDSARFALLKNQIAIPGEARDIYYEVLYAYENWWITDPELYMIGSDSTLWTWGHLHLM